MSGNPQVNKITVSCHNKCHDKKSFLLLMLVGGLELSTFSKFIKQVVNGWYKSIRYTASQFTYYEAEIL
jgi:hypothetical protein